MGNTHAFSRFDMDNPLASCSPHPILLEDKNWTTCEHYVQAKIMRYLTHADTIESLSTGADAVAYAKPWYRLKIKDYKKLAPIFMSRALYTKVQMYEEVRDALFKTGEQKIIETSQYDYFWGIGRDLRGYNHLGNIWMDIRARLKSDQL